MQNNRKLISYIYIGNSGTSAQKVFVAKIANLAIS